MRKPLSLCLIWHLEISQDSHVQSQLYLNGLHQSTGNSLLLPQYFWYLVSCLYSLKPSEYKNLLIPAGIILSRITTFFKSTFYQHFENIEAGPCSQ